MASFHCVSSALLQLIANRRLHSCMGMTSPPIAQRVESLDVVCGENAVTKAAVLTGQLHQSCSHLLGQKVGALNSALDSPTSETDLVLY